MRALRRFWREKRGASAVEFAIVAFPFFLVLYGTLEFGRAHWTRETLQAIANTGARCMGLVQSGCGTSGTYNASQTTTYVQSVATSWGITVASSSITPVRTTATTCAGVSNTVNGSPAGFSVLTLTYSFQTAVPRLISPLVPLPISVTACFPNQS